MPTAAEVKPVDTPLLLVKACSPPGHVRLRCAWRVRSAFCARSGAHRRSRAPEPPDRV